MYSTCLYCNSALGHNEVIEPFPVGRRLAFDADRGRLWAVCPSCARWNLTPIEERWEAIECCDRLFRDTPLRASTDNIGLATVREGLELVRIGQPQRPEFAAWRYGGEFARRRKRSIAFAGVGIAIVGGVQFALQEFNPAWYVALPAISNASTLVDVFRAYRYKLRPVVRLGVGDGEVVVVRGKHVSGASLLSHDDGTEWRLRVDHRRGFTVLDGDAAHRTLGRFLAHANFDGGNRKTVARAVEQLTSARSADEFIVGYVKRVNRESRFNAPALRNVDPESLGAQSTDGRLALEMALHEETERAALEGELAALADAWKEAEEIAAIADDLLLPSSITQRLSDLRTTGRE